MSFDKESFALGIRNSGLSAGALTVSENGVYLAPTGEAYNKVTVDVEQGVFPSGTLNITDNGDYSVSQYENVSVNVENSGVEILVPDGYTQMEYLESTGEQYIKTGHYVTNDTVFEVFFRHLLTGDQFLFGVNTENENEGCYMDVAGSLYFKFGVGNYRSFQIMHNYVYSMKMNRSGVYFKTKLPDEERPAYINTNSPLVGTGEIYLFGRNNVSDGTVGFSKVRLGRYTVYEGETKVQDMVPALRNSDSVLGMYDILNDIFYTNSGTVAFTGGALD